jgi:exopolyphosphatase/guanosine-5'-triphosphate,3'-diphosphate pyrophosphatase
MAIARRYDVDLRHARHVAVYGRQIVDALRDRYDLSERDEVIFHVAALLHEVGQSINSSGHHKHSRYLILNSDIFGLGRRDITLAALVARYHRRATPRPSHADYMELNRADRIRVCKLSAIMRVANALDRLHSPRPLKLDMRIEDKRFVIEALTDSDLSLLQRRVQERSQLFSSIFGKEILLRAKGT